jgi:hypothetical protein
VDSTGTDAGQVCAVSNGVRTPHVCCWGTSDPLAVVLGPWCHNVDQDTVKATVTSGG